MLCLIVIVIRVELLEKWDRRVTEGSGYVEDTSVVSLITVMILIVLTVHSEGILDVHGASEVRRRSCQVVCNAWCCHSDGLTSDIHILKVKDSSNGLGIDEWAYSRIWHSHVRVIWHYCRKWLPEVQTDQIVDIEYSSIGSRGISIWPWDGYSRRHLYQHLRMIQIEASSAWYS